VLKPAAGASSRLSTTDAGFAYDNNNVNEHHLVYWADTADNVICDGKQRRQEEPFIMHIKEDCNCEPSAEIECHFEVKGTYFTAPIKHTVIIK
jgi:hypothetical protein